LWLIIIKSSFSPVINAEIHADRHGLYLSEILAASTSTKQSSFRTHYELSRERNDGDDEQTQNKASTSSHDETMKPMREVWILV
jgi:hypothetical protein